MFEAARGASAINGKQTQRRIKPIGGSCPKQSATRFHLELELELRLKCVCSAVVLNCVLTTVVPEKQESCKQDKSCPFGRRKWWIALAT